MGMMFMAVGRMSHFILKLLCAAGALMLCVAKIFIVMLFAVLQIVFGIVRLGETV